jgi:5-methylcytosine-specific restriction endonuclease McrA
MNKQGLLHNIREQIRARQAANTAPKPAAPSCPKCAHELTIDHGSFFTSEICENCFDHVKVFDNKECCTSPSFSYVKLVTATGAIQVKEQCQTCGLVKASAVGGFSKEQKERLPLLDETLRQQRYTRMSQESRAIYATTSEKRQKNYEQQRKDRRQAWMKEYGRYLNSPEWKQKRELVLKRDNYKCQCCLTGLATQVHHKSYEFVDLAGNEPCFDLVAVCGPCHERIETMKAEKRKSNNP